MCRGKWDEHKPWEQSGGSKHMPMPSARKTEVLVSSRNSRREKHRGGSWEIRESYQNNKLQLFKF